METKKHHVYTHAHHPSSMTVSRESSSRTVSSPPSSNPESIRETGGSVKLSSTRLGFVSPESIRPNVTESRCSRRFTIRIFGDGFELSLPADRNQSRSLDQSLLFSYLVFITDPRCSRHRSSLVIGTSEQISLDIQNEVEHCLIRYRP